MPTPPKNKQPLDLLALRHACGLNQIAFWRKVGGTQSTGSRYENGYRMPPPVAQLVDLVYVRSIDIAKVDGESLAILAYLRQQHPDLHAQMLKAVRQKQRAQASD